MRRISIDLVNGRPRIFRARRFVTLDSGMPTAEAVAVLDGRVLHSGSFADVMADLAGRQPIIDDSFIDKVVVPGFVEAHSHMLQEGSRAAFPWIGAYPRMSADGAMQPGCPTLQSVLERIREAHLVMADPDEVLTCLGWDPNMAGGEQLTVDLLDRISDTRPIFVLQSSGHIGLSNSALMRRAGITRETADHGVMRNAGGEPNGELREMALTLVLGKHVRVELDPTIAAINAGVLARRVGCTTVTDLAFTATERMVTSYGAVVERDDVPMRVVYAPLVPVMAKRFGESTFDHVTSLLAHNSDKFRMGPIKFIIDGSIQGRSARMDWPGYCCGDPNGMWFVEPDEIFELMLPYHRAGFQLAMHANGDEAIDRGVDVYEKLLADTPRFDHRHRLEHAQLATDHAFRRMRALGLCVNLFANHIYYWGETHRELTAGPARARKLDACGTAKRLGVPFSIHCDAPVTPLDPLFTMWCAVNRITSAGRVLGESERIDAESALRAVTLDAAYLLKLDDRIGSIESGKYADFTVLDDDPLAIDPIGLKEIGVAATVLAGSIFEN